LDNSEAYENTLPQNGILGSNGEIMPKSRWLILETSGQVGQVALAVGDQLCAQRNLDAARRHARDLAPAVGEMLAEQGWKPRELTGVFVSRGPGSYTGLRVGIMSAKTFAYATGCALIAVDTFAAVAWQAPFEAEHLEVIGDAQQDKLYVQQFTRAGDKGFRAVNPLSILPFADWLDRRDPACWLSGPGLHRFATRLPEDCRVVEAGYWDAGVSALLQIGLDRYERGERDDPWTLEPLYLRPSSAEEQWAKRPE
jgi:tRNA threonylcarbamoyladenosine biosynthesis protein TsaB